MVRFDKQVGVITGAASGIGKEIALRYASEGGTPVIADLNLAAAQATADEIKAKGADAFAVAMNVIDEAAVAARVRLVSVNRPGYGGSSLSTAEAPSLLAVGKDTAALAALLGLEQYAVIGISGGGPFAAATAVADRDAVHALGVVDGTGHDGEEGRGQLAGQGAVLEAVGEAVAVNEVHGVVVTALDAAGPVDLDDVRVLQARGGAHLGLEAGQVGWVGQGL